MHFMDVKETSKFSSLVIYSHQKNEHLKKIKECSSAYCSKPGMSKGHYLSVELRLTIHVPFLS